MIRVVAPLDKEYGWTRHASSFAVGLSRLEQTELIDWHATRRRGLRARVRNWRIRLSDSVEISLGILGRTGMLGTRFRIAFSIWETTRIPLPHLYTFQQADMVWTMSSWGQDLLEAHGVLPAKIRIVPAGVDTSVFVPSTTRSPAAVFRFLCIGKWEERKGTADLVTAFVQEFDPAEPVELVMHCGTPHARGRNFREEISRILARHGRTAARILPSDPLDLPQLVALIHSCHAFVLPTRGEGWGLPILEAMACELPCIITDYSGLKEFANENNAYLVRVERLLKAEDPDFFGPDTDWGLWAQPDLAHLRSLMRLVYQNPEAAAAKGKRAREDAIRFWTWNMAAEKAMAHIEELRSGGCRSET